MSNYPPGVTDDDPYFTDESEYEDEPEPSLEVCEYRCNDGWLPFFDLTRFRRCFCNESDLLPEGVSL